MLNTPERIASWGIRPRDGRWPFPFGRTIRVLVVADGEASFLDYADFGLTEFINALKTTDFFFAHYEVTTAHRSPAGNHFADSADVKSFSFDDATHFGRDHVDVLFLFGFYAQLDDQSGAPHRPLTDAERAVVAKFMDAGGGVFATGDHEDLGADLCGSLPRVRHMRRWTFDETKYGNEPGQTPWDTFDEGTGWSPPKFGRHRHDTLVVDAQGRYLFENQSDNRPASITLKIYQAGLERYPHPLLCSPTGPIDILPDHMHEGECILPTPEQLAGTYAAGDYHAPEYPTTKAGVQVAPDIIAWGVIVPGHTTSTAGYGVDSPVLADSFGAVAVYDGQAVGVGRVVTDSTIHHFYNINLNGTGNAGMPTSAYQGFVGTPAYEVIKSYFRNLAWWLAPAPLQLSMLTHTVWAARWDSELRMLARFPEPGKSPFSDLVAYGRGVRRLLGQYSSPCASIDWSLGGVIPLLADPLSYLLSSSWYNLIHLPDPPPEGVAITLEEVASAICACVMVKVMRAFRTRTEFKDSETLSRALLPLVREGSAEAMRAVTAALRARANASVQLADRLLNMPFEGRSREGSV